MDILSTHDLTDETIQKLFRQARDLETFDAMRRNHGVTPPKPLSNQSMATLFLEPSTRTRLSFEAAMVRLGGSVISTAEPNGSSVAKGETIYDTIMTVAQYADVVVVRSPVALSEWGEPLYDEWPVPVINAGDGMNEHPTQALLDAYTIWKRFRSLEGIQLGIVGDLYASRTIHSLIEIMGRTANNTLYLLDTTGKTTLDKDREPIAHITYLKNPMELEEILPQLNVLYTNRIQTERHSETCDCGFSLTESHLARLESDAIVMNPGPRREELPPELDDDPKVVFFEQARNGVFARMALLKWIFETDSRLVG